MLPRCLTACVLCAQFWILGGAPAESSNSPTSGEFRGDLAVFETRFLTWSSVPTVGQSPGKVCARSLTRVAHSSFVRAIAEEWHGDGCAG